MDGPGDPSYFDADDKRGTVITIRRNETAGPAVAQRRQIGIERYLGADSPISSNADYSRITDDTRTQG